MLTVLSPHLDDAVLSVSGALRSAPDAVVVTCFAGVPEPGTPPSEWDQRCGVRDVHAQLLARRAEDVAALRALGAGRPVHLDLLDAPYRQEALAEVGRRLLLELEELVPEQGRLLAPLGIGGHTDHVLVRAVAVELAAARPRLRLELFADQPYAAERGWPTWVLPPVRRQVRRLRDRTRTPPDREKSWRLALQDAPPVGPPEVHMLRRSALRRKRAAVAAHASQLPSLGGLRHAAGRLEVIYPARHDHHGKST